LNACKMSWGDRPKQVRAIESETRRSKDGQRDGERGIRFCLLLEAVGEECVSFGGKGRGEVLYHEVVSVSCLHELLLCSQPLLTEHFPEKTAAISRRGNARRKAHGKSNLQGPAGGNAHWLFAGKQVKPGA
jgi:hypothetical protein